VLPVIVSLLVVGVVEGQHERVHDDMAGRKRKMQVIILGERSCNYTLYNY